MGSQTPCQEKAASLTTSQYDLSFKCFNEQWNRQQCKHLKWYSLGIWTTTSGLGYEDTFVLTNADFLSYTFPLPQLVRLCREQAENESRGEDKRTTEPAYLLPAAARGRCYFPALSPVLPASGSWASPVPCASFPSSSPTCTKPGTHWALHWDDLTHKAPTKLLFFFG